MADITINDVGVEFGKSPVFVCDLKDMGACYDEALADKVIETAPERLVREPSEDGQSRREARARSYACEQAATKLFRPVIDQVFSGSQFYLPRYRWDLFGVNYYETGDRFAMHEDYRTPKPLVVVILSLCGVRTLTVIGQRPEQLTPGKIAFLDGRANPLHAADCTEGPSVSVVADVPDVHF